MTTEADPTLSITGDAGAADEGVVAGPTRSPVRRWAIAVLAAALAVGVRQALHAIVQEPIAWIVTYPAVVLVSLRQGFAPGLLTAALCALGATLLGPQPLSAIELPVQWGLFGVAAIVIALACSQSARGRRHEAPGGTVQVVDTPITRWLRAVVCGAALIPLTIFVCACWWGHAEAIAIGQERVTRANVATLHHAERSFEKAFEVLRKARDLAAQPDDELRAADAEVRQRLQDMMLGTSAVQAIMVWDADGRGVTGTLQNVSTRIPSVADRPYFQRARRGESDVILSDPIRGRITGITVVNAALRRSTPDGRFAGVVVVSLYPSFFQDFYQSLANEESGLATFALFTAGGSVLARWPAAQTDNLRVPEDSKLAEATRAGTANGVLRLRSKVDGKPRMISFMRVPGLPLYASVALDEAAIFEPWHRFVALLAAVLGPLTLGLVYVSWLALKKTRREQAVVLELQAEMRRRAQTEKALAHSQRLEALSVLTGGVAHDFNNLLAIVNGNIHMIRRLHPDVGNGRHLTAIARAVASGVRLTRQLLSFARRQALKPEQVVLQTWLPGMADLLQSTVGHGIALSIEVPPDTPPIRVDAGELELALINLATNARDAMNERGTLHLEVAVPPAVAGTGAAQVEIRVRDDGSGIAPALLAKVFEPFFTTKAPNKGTGLGLSQVYGFCLQAGGAASVASTVGTGTTVTMRLPADPQAEAPGPAGATLATSVRVGGRALLVEDNRDVAEAHRELLASTGLHVEVATSGDEALQKLAGREAAFDIVVSDIAMPGSVDGVQLAARLAVSRPGLPVVLLTGYAARLEDARALGLPVLAKPVDAETLIAEIRRALRAGAFVG